MQRERKHFSFNQKNSLPKDPLYIPLLIFLILYTQNPFYAIDKVASFFFPFNMDKVPV